jgi:pimeloyl-ACP methyl ester carboxylesterase
MANYVLVHGGMVTGAVWDKVARLLKKSGHMVFAPTLSPPQNSSLEGHIREVCSLIEKESMDNVVLAGHSAGGLVITGVADRMPGRIKRLVYLDTAFPENGKSLYGLIESYGISIEKYGLERFGPFTDPLYFDAAKIRRIPRFYVHCKQSSFVLVGRHAFAKVLLDAEAGRWDYFILDTGHACMVSQPQETAEILLLAAGR